MPNFKVADNLPVNAYNSNIYASETLINNKLNKLVYQINLTLIKYDKFFSGVLNCPSDSRDINTRIELSQSNLIKELSNIKNDVESRINKIKTDIKIEFNIFKSNIKSELNDFKKNIESDYFKVKQENELINASLMETKKTMQCIIDLLVDKNVMVNHNELDKYTSINNISPIKPHTNKLGNEIQIDSNDIKIEVINDIEMDNDNKNENDIDNNTYYFDDTSLVPSKDRANLTILRKDDNKSDSKRGSVELDEYANAAAVTNELLDQKNQIINDLQLQLLDLKKKLNDFKKENDNIWTSRNWFRNQISKKN